MAAIDCKFIKRTYSCCIIFSTLLLSSCFTIPGTDRIVVIDSYINKNTSCVQPLPHTVDRIEYIPADQSLSSKVHYIDQCMINYSWGRGWTSKQDFQN